jgi:hypothetical protein
MRRGARRRRVEHHALVQLGYVQDVAVQIDPAHHGCVIRLVELRWTATSRSSHSRANFSLTALSSAISDLMPWSPG